MDSLRGIFEEINQIDKPFKLKFVDEVKRNVFECFNCKSTPLKIAFRHIRPNIMNLVLFDFVRVFSEIVSVFEVIQTHLYQICDWGILSFIHVLKKNYICI